ncbi:hypothetical protein dsx2_3382 [Desulfovibrio sp. X2]|uniref:APC family permease n=1 Tax=Desulfovibrio sp. X2 TaxID=941449 RepID=UPI000358AEF3|nr:APC family permease [Desulfovibrio sp. X2]EPR40143.1 hypothetical protein dsx2_3382 [Desulfovibrio sp. X2]
MNDSKRAGSAGPSGGGLRRLLVGGSLDLGDHSIFHKLSLIAFFAWVGLGADGLSSSCYGPAEAYLALGRHTVLALVVALASALTIFVISASYSQIIELFPSGGGGYIVASRLLSPHLGMISGSALLIDYVLTITISIASGADAVFSFLPPAWAAYRIHLAAAGVLLLTFMNLRGVKESVKVLVPVFMVFVITHIVVIAMGLGTHLAAVGEVATRLGRDLSAAHSELGAVGLVVVLLRAYSMGAGTYTGIEAVSNGLPILREPKVATGKRTMLYMATSLSVTVIGIILLYLLFNVSDHPGMTLNAVAFSAVTARWPAPWGQGFVMLTLASEALLLFVAAQAGFVDGPRVMANMALDRWLPTRFASLSDRLVTENGILLMGGAAMLLLLATRGSVDLLIVLYSINVFITFVLSQLGMVLHWWRERRSVGHAWRRLLVNGLGLAMTAFILVSVIAVKFDEGGWVTLVITGCLIWLAVAVRRHYDGVGRLLRSLDVLVPPEGADDACTEVPARAPASGPGEHDACAGQERSGPPEIDPDAPTAVLLVNGFNGLGLHTLFDVFRYYRHDFRNFVFLQVGVVDASVFKTPEELANLKKSMERGLSRYTRLMQARGYAAEAHWAVGTEVAQEVMALAPALVERFPRAVFFGGQIVFEKETFLTRILHNSVVFSLQRQMCRHGIPFMIMPIAVDKTRVRDDAPPPHGADCAV